MSPERHTHCLARMLEWVAPGQGSPTGEVTGRMEKRLAGVFLAGWESWRAVKVAGQTFTGYSSCHGGVALVKVPDASSPSSERTAVQTKNRMERKRIKFISLAGCTYKRPFPFTLSLFLLFPLFFSSIYSLIVIITHSFVRLSIYKSEVTITFTFASSSLT